MLRSELMFASYMAAIQIERDGGGPQHDWHFDKRIVSLDILSNDKVKLDLTLSIPPQPGGANRSARMLALVMFDANPDLLSEALFDKLTRKKVTLHTATETTAPQEQQGVLHPENQLIGINIEVALHSVCFKLSGVVEGPTYKLLVVVRSEDSGHHVFAQGACARCAGAPSSAPTTVLRASARSVAGRRYASITAGGASARCAGAQSSATTTASSTAARSASPVIDCD